ncbi:MAG: AAA family ATPase [Chloroflexi bacterium]|nr:AAA family ATPase [Chloroflexota bacterium]
MYLRRLDLVGFKSFATRVTTELQPGIVVIVGPNGSGKSNVSDALLWVLGEQSAKAVRARKSEEVIFAGSASRQPLGMAEVSLVLDNADASLPIEYDEVRVTRRLYRSGESEYLVNGARVRLKDITQLLLHAGLSPDSYAIVGQGSIDELILQRPDERRVVFENVADVRRHQLRLTETRSKLAATQANLVRVQDILAELTPHVRRLKTQAERSERAEHFRTELRTLLLRTFRWRLSRARAEQRQAEADSQAAAARAQQAEVESLGGEQTLRAIDERLAQLEVRFSELRPRAEAFREQLRVAERGLAVVRERLAAMGDQRSTAEIDVERLRGALERLAADEQAASLETSETGLASPSEADRLAELRSQLGVEAGALEAAQSDRSAQQSQLERTDAAIRDAEGRLARTTQHVTALQANLAVDQARQTDRASRLATLEQQLASLDQERGDQELAVEQTRARLTSAADARSATAARLESARERLRVASQQADRLHGALQALGAADLDRSDDSDLPTDWQTALAGLPVVGLAGELAARIRPIDLLLAGYVRRIVVLADDAAAREAHHRLATRLPTDAPAWAVLSLDGLLLTGEGPRPMDVVADQGQSTLADWSRQVRELEADLDASETERRSALAEVQAARDALDDAEASERGARLALGEIDARLTELRRAERAARSEAEELRVAHERAARSAEQRGDERERTATQARAVEEELAEARARHATLGDAVRQAEERVALSTERVGLVRTEVAALEAAAGRREAERAAREALHTRIRSEIESSLALRDAAVARMQQLDLQQTDLQARESDLARDLEALQRELEPADLELQSAEQRRADLLGERQSAEQQVAVLRAAERAAQEQREARHVVAQRALDDLERLKTEIDETAELESELSGDVMWAEQLRLALDVGEVEPHEALDVDAARRRIATLQRELRGAGGVAESVVAEYREMSERHAFLEQQSADLRSAMAELEQAAVELEGHMRERFSETFGAIQAAFQECFGQLFGGGEARLVLTEPDDLLRTGIDIVARPPGKKLQGLLSLSGGERALTVVSLLFGLMKINPTPFCVLDEVDAALDEANVQRFANLLAELSRRIQFIVVTHNRATMDKADAMYGVSMDAAGVSHVFSVRPGSVLSSAARSADRSDDGAEPVADEHSLIESTP